jgi:PAS domain S-box-containing protein
MVSLDITQELEAAQQIQQQKQQLEELHTRMDRAALSSQEGYFEFDLSTGGHWVSSSYKPMMSYPQETDLSTYTAVSALIHPDDRKGEFDDLLSLPPGQLLTVTSRMRNGKGQYRWMQTRCGVERDADGKPVRITGSLRDIHEQKIAEQQLQTAQERFTRAISGTSDGLWEVDMLADRYWLSPTYMAILGYEAAENNELHGADIRAMVHPGDYDDVIEKWERVLQQREPLDFEFRMHKRNLEFIWVKMRGTVDFDQDGKPLRAAGSLSDVTTAHQALELLVKATEEAQDASRAKSAFLANMSHEIRTPMNGIIGMTGLLLDTDLDQSQREFSDIIRASGESLLTIINDILDFSKIEAGKLDIDEVEMDLRSTVEDVGAMLGLQAAVKKLEFVVNVAPDIPAQMLGDPQRIRQCLMNLASNAIKFTRQGEVVIDVSKHSGSDDEQLYFEVRDTGIGLAPQALAKLFQPFMQADSSTTRKYGGTGLGLSIVKRLVEMMGGTVGVDSQAGVGSKFWFTLPLHRLDSGANAPATDAQLLRGKRLLIVDDNATNRRVLSLQLAHLGCAVTISDGGEAAMIALEKQRAAGQQFDAVLTDFQMPDMDGGMLAARIGAEPDLAALPLILLTSMDRQSDSQTFAAMGFAAYLIKPIRSRDLRDCLMRVLGADHAASATQSLSGEARLISGGGLSSAVERFVGKALLVDDNLVNQQVGRRFLERLGLTVELACDGAEAVQAYQAGSFDIIFMDLQMPVMDGYEATRRIRDFEAWRPRKPIVALTANAMRGQMERCIATGMDDFLTKPINRDHLRLIVSKYCPPAAAEITVSESSALPAPATELDGPTIAALLETPVIAARAKVNVDKLKRTADGDLDFMRDLIQLYIEGSEPSLSELKTACAADDRTVLRRVAHKLKGASASIHADELVEACTALEHHDENLSHAELQALVQKLEQALTDVVTELTRLINDIQSAA